MQSKSLRTFQKAAWRVNAQTIGPRLVFIAGGDNNKTKQHKKGLNFLGDLVGFSYS